MAENGSMRQNSDKDEEEIFWLDIHSVVECRFLGWSSERMVIPLPKTENIGKMGSQDSNDNETYYNKTYYKTHAYKGIYCM